MNTQIVSPISRHGKLMSLGLGVLLGLIGGLGGLVPVQAVDIPFFENFTLRPGFSPDPMSVSGLSGGEISAQSLSNNPQTPTGSCEGFIDKDPDHTMTLTEFFSYLRVDVQSDEDTTLVIMGPGGTWCNDEYNGNNPGMAGEWLPGTYKIWVGSYQKNKFPFYTMQITQRQP